jgi:hypothetical protein
MRTSITLDDTLYAQLRSRAHSAHVSMGDLIQSAVRAALAAPVITPTAPFRLPTLRSGLVQGVSVEAATDLADAQEGADRLSRLANP